MRKKAENMERERTLEGERRINKGRKIKTDKATQKIKDSPQEKRTEKRRDEQEPESERESDTHGDRATMLSLLTTGK